jgi:Ran GTPase-activating protein (RanGAP) involved in mRNA processing and transport
VLMDVLSKALIAADYDGLRCLRFWNCGFGDVGMKFLSEGLLNLPKLVQLDVTDCLFGPVGCGYLAGYLRKISKANVETVKLDYNDIGSEGLKILCDGLMFNCALKKLSLAYCNIDARGGAELTRVLSRQEIGLTNLNLEGNELGSRGIIELSMGIGKNRTLQKLNISSNKFGGTEEEMKALCRGFKSCTTLSQIDMDGNLIKDAGLSFMIANLHDCTHIWDLDVSADVDPELLNQHHAWLNKNVPKKS